MIAGRSKSVARKLFPVWLGLLCLALSTGAWSQQDAIPSWGGELRDATGAPMADATIWLTEQGHRHAAATAANGSFTFKNLPAGNYMLSVESAGKVVNSSRPILLEANHVAVLVTLSGQDALTVVEQNDTCEATGGEQLSSRAVSELPLNKRDFSQLLLLAAGTMTDANGATNFTQQFAINGQRGVEATFAMDGADTSDPEMGGGTFTNFNVDAVEEIQSSSGWMPAEIGRGAAGFTNIITRSGKSGFHGSVFEFLRNSALDARNYFDHSDRGKNSTVPAQ